MATFEIQFIRKNNGDYAGGAKVTGTNRHQVLTKAKKAAASANKRLESIWTTNWRARIWKDGSWTKDANTHLPN